MRQRPLGTEVYLDKADTGRLAAGTSALTALVSGRSLPAPQAYEASKLPSLAENLVTVDCLYPLPLAADTAIKAVSSLPGTQNLNPQAA